MIAVNSLCMALSLSFLNERHHIATKEWFHSLSNYLSLLPINFPLYDEQKTSTNFGVKPVIGASIADHSGLSIPIACLENGRTDKGEASSLQASLLYGTFRRAQPLLWRPKSPKPFPPVRGTLSSLSRNVKFRGWQLTTPKQCSPFSEFAIPARPRPGLFDINQAIKCIAFRRHTQFSDDGSICSRDLGNVATCAYAHEYFSSVWPYPGPEASRAPQLSHRSSDIRLDSFPGNTQGERRLQCVEHDVWGLT